MAGDREESKRRRVDLQAAEAELLVKALQRYRASLPIYLQSAERELELVDALLTRLAKNDNHSR